MIDPDYATAHGSRSSNLGNGDASDRFPPSSPGRRDKNVPGIMDSLGKRDRRTSYSRKKRKRNLKNLRILGLTNHAST